MAKVRHADGTFARPGGDVSVLPSPYRATSSGIYAIINRCNNKIYIGSALRLNARWRVHRCELLAKTHDSRYLQRAFNQDPEAFYIEVVEELPSNVSKSTLLSREQFWMDFYKSYIPSNGYNLCPKAESCQGVKRDLEYLKRVRGVPRKPWSEETRKRYAAIRAAFPRRGWKWKPEHIKILSESHKGIRWAQGQKEKFLNSNRRNPRGFNRKRVSQISSDGTVLRTFDSIKEIGLALGRQTRNISAVCKGKRKSAFGFKWKYA